MHILVLPWKNERRRHLSDFTTYMSNTAVPGSYNKRDLLTLLEHLGSTPSPHPRFFGGVCVAPIFNVLCCVVFYIVFVSSRVLCVQCWQYIPCLVCPMLTVYPRVLCVQCWQYIPCPVCPMLTVYPVSCVSNVDSAFGLSILDWPFCFL
jgi:hypothetical protein